MFGTRSGSPLRAKFVADAKRIDPSFNEGDYKRIQGVITEYANQQGDAPGAQIRSFNTFMGHADEFMDEVQKLRGSTTGIPLLNQPLNWLKKNAAGNQTISDLYSAMVTMRTEQGKFLEGKGLTEVDKKDLEEKMNLAMTPAQMEGVAKQMMTGGVTRLGDLDQSYFDVTGKHVPGLLHPVAQQALTRAANGKDVESKTLASNMQRYLPAQAFTGQRPAQAGATAEPPRPPGTPPNFVYMLNGPHGSGFYNPTPGNVTPGK
jgi:hypothetical protein